MEGWEESCGESGYCLRQRDLYQGEPAGARRGEELRAVGRGAGIETGELCGEWGTWSARAKGSELCRVRGQRGLL